MQYLIAAFARLLGSFCFFMGMVFCHDGLKSTSAPILFLGFTMLVTGLALVAEA